jgi:hypothetical protein
VDPPLPLEEDELLRKGGRVWARKLAYRGGVAKLAAAVRDFRDAGKQDAMFFADMRRLRPVWLMRLWKHPASSAFELLVQVCVCVV